MADLLTWTTVGEDHHAYCDRTHYVIYQRSDGKWAVPLFSMFTDEPDGPEDKLGKYLPSSLDDAKELAGALAEQRRLFGTPPTEIG